LFPCTTLFRSAEAAQRVVGRGVDYRGVVEGADRDSALGQLVEEVQGLAQVPAESVELGDHDAVPTARVVQELGEAGPVGVLARFLVRPDLLDAGVMEPVELGIQ